MKDGVPTRDRTGLEFPAASGAIEHSKELARRLRQDPRRKDPALSIVVLDESAPKFAGSRCNRTHRNLASPATSPTDGHVSNHRTRLTQQFPKSAMRMERALRPAIVRRRMPQASVTF
jgi:hypothetical protein